jgi:hypothetical protein
MTSRCQRVTDSALLGCQPQTAKALGLTVSQPDDDQPLIAGLVGRGCQPVIAMMT